MQQFEFALSVIPKGCLSAVIAKSLCHAAVFTTFLRVLATPEVDTGWPSHQLFLILFFPLKLELFTFQICNFFLKFIFSKLK
jgi:hypothetical protein